MNKRGIVTIILSSYNSSHSKFVDLLQRLILNDSTNTANTSIVTSGNMRGVWLQQQQI